MQSKSYFEKRFVEAHDYISDQSKYRGIFDLVVVKFFSNRIYQGIGYLADNSYSKIKTIRNSGFHEFLTNPSNCFNHQKKNSCGVFACVVRTHLIYMWFFFKQLFPVNCLPG